MTKYKSKIDIGLVLFLGTVFGTIALLMALEQIWLGFTIILLVICFVIYLFSSTYYAIDGKVLKVKAGFLIDLKIDIDAINEIRKTRSILSAPALSFDRIEIRYNGHSGIIISPKDKEDFVLHLIRINPNIVSNLS